MIKHIFIFGFLFFTIQSFGQVAIDVKDAIDAKIIDYTITGSWDSSNKLEFLDADGQYFGKCMTIKLHNSADSAISIFFKNGLMLMCEDTATQDMILSKTIYVELYPKQYKTIQLYAMCSEIHNGMPNTKTIYKIGTFADSNLVAITSAIEEMLMHNIAGQGAIWAYTDKATKDDLSKYGATQNTLRLTIDILNKVGVITKLNPLIISSDSSVVVTEEIALEQNLNDGFVSINKNVFYIISCFIILLIGTIVVLIFIKRKNNSEEKI